jgi:hypothetical protein
LCTDRDHALVEYALTAVDNRLFVSKYQLELPSKVEIERFIDEKSRQLTGEMVPRGKTND